MDAIQVTTCRPLLDQHQVLLRGREGGMLRGEERGRSREGKADGCATQQDPNLLPSKPGWKAVWSKAQELCRLQCTRPYAWTQRWNACLLHQ